MNWAAHHRPGHARIRRIESSHLVRPYYPRHPALTGLGWAVLIVAVACVAAAASIALGSCEPLDLGSERSSADVIDSLDGVAARLEALEQLDRAAVRLMEAQRTHADGWASVRRQGAP